MKDHNKVYKYDIGDELLCINQGTHTIKIIGFKPYCYIIDGTGKYEGIYRNFNYDKDWVESHNFVPLTKMSKLLFL